MVSSHRRTLDKRIVISANSPPTSSTLTASSRRARYKWPVGDGRGNVWQNALANYLVGDTCGRRRMRRRTHRTPSTSSGRPGAHSSTPRGFRTVRRMTSVGRKHEREINTPNACNHFYARPMHGHRGICFLRSIHATRVHSRPVPSQSHASCRFFSSRPRVGLCAHCTCLMLAYTFPLSA